MIRPPAVMIENPRFSPARDADGKRIYVQDPNGKLYAPTSAKRGTIAKLDFGFATLAAQEDLCSACGTSLEGRVRVFMQECGSEPPLHAACAAYALIACPHLAREMNEVYLATDTDLIYREDDPEYEDDQEIGESEERPEFAPDGRQVEPDVRLFLKYAQQIDAIDADEAIDLIKHIVQEDFIERAARERSLVAA
jgi:hypothetical protein